MSGDRSARSGAEPAFSISHESTPSDALIAGFSNVGLTGLTPADFLVDRLELEETGHVAVDQLPAITPSSRDGRATTRAFSPRRGWARRC